MVKPGKSLGLAAENSGRYKREPKRKNQHPTSNEEASFGLSVIRKSSIQYRRRPGGDEEYEYEEIVRDPSTSLRMTRRWAIGDQLMSFILAKLLKRRIAAQGVPRWIEP